MWVPIYSAPGQKADSPVSFNEPREDAGCKAYWLGSKYPKKPKKCNFRFAKNCKVYLFNALWTLATMADPEMRTIFLILELLFQFPSCLQTVSVCSNWKLVLLLSTAASFFFIAFDVQNSLLRLLMLLKNDCSQTNSNIYKVCCSNLTYSIFHPAQLVYSPITSTRCCNIVPNFCVECSVKGCCMFPHQHSSLSPAITSTGVPNLLKITDGTSQRQEEKFKFFTPLSSSSF